MSETERPGRPGDEEHEGDLGINPTPDDIPDSDDLDPDAAREREEGEDDGPEVDQLDEDPAYDPDDPGLKGIKGG